MRLALFGAVAFVISAHAHDVAPIPTTDNIIAGGSAHEAPRPPQPAPPPPPPPLCDLASCGPLRTSASGRFLAHRDGTLFYYVADTPWHLLQDVSLAEAQAFIDLRLGQGFTALQLNALGMGGDPNAQGDRFGNWTALNPPHWSHVDAVLKYMEQRGMVAYLLPIWAFNWACPGPGNKCPSGRPSASLSDHFAFGKTLGARWRGYGNIVWVLGGDISDPPIAKYRQLLAGIRAGGAQQLLTAHPRAPGSSSEFLPAELDFFSVQNRAGRSGGGGTNTTGELTRKDALATFPAARGGSVRTNKPVLMAETWYEDWAGGGVVDLQYKRGAMLRDAFWGARLSGSLGEGYGVDLPPAISPPFAPVLRRLTDRISTATYYASSWPAWYCVPQATGAAGWRASPARTTSAVRARPLAGAVTSSCPELSTSPCT